MNPYLTFIFGVLVGELAMLATQAFFKGANSNGQKRNS
jgi:hypothetical protein